VDGGGRPGLTGPAGTLVAVGQPSDPGGAGDDWIVDEEQSSRHLIRQQLELAPSERLRGLQAAYVLFLAGHRRLGRPVFEPR